jgi:hypothetical protein
MVLVAKSGEDELMHRTITVWKQDGAVVFEADTKPDYMSEGGIHATVYPRVNAVGDLVVQSDWLRNGSRRPKLELATAKFDATTPAFKAASKKSGFN